MAVIRVSMDTSLSPTGSLSPVALEVISGTLDLLYFICLRAERDSVRVSVEDYSVVIDQIDFSNPIDIWATLKNVTVGTVHSILDRTIFYKLERERRALENQKLKQEVVDLTLKNAERIPRTRRMLIKGGVSERSAERLLGRLLADQSLSIEINPSKERPPRLRMR